MLERFIQTARDSKAALFLGYAALFALFSLFVYRFGAVPLGSLMVVAAVSYLALKNPRHALLMTTAAMFFPANFERALGLSFFITPTRLAGLLLVLSLVLSYRRLDWGRLRGGHGAFFWAVALMLWGAITLIVFDPALIGYYLSEVLPSLTLLVAVILLMDGPGEIFTLYTVIALAVCVTAISGMVGKGQVVENRAAGLALNPNTLAANCILGIGFGLALWKRAQRGWIKLFWVAVFLLFAVTIAYTASRSGMIALATMTGALLLWSIKNRQVKIWALLLLGLAVFLLYAPRVFWERMGNLLLMNNMISTPTSETAVREWMYPRGWQLFRDSPIIGWGAFRFPYVSGTGARWSMHSWYLAMLCEQGMIGFALYAVLFVVAGRNIYLAKRLLAADDAVSGAVNFLEFAAIGLAVMGAFATNPLDKVVFVIVGLSVALAETGRSKRHDGGAT